jgi:hypothetical protein
MNSSIIYGKRIICYPNHTVNKDTYLTFWKGSGNVTSTIPAKPLNDAQIGGLLFEGRRTTVSQKVSPAVMPAKAGIQNLLVINSKKDRPSAISENVCWKSVLKEEIPS